MDSLARQLRRKKVRILRGPIDRSEWMLRTTHFRDPDGYLVEVCSEIART